LPRLALHRPGTFFREVVMDERVKDVALALVLVALLLVVCDAAVECLDWAAQRQAERGTALSVMVAGGGE